MAYQHVTKGSGVVITLRNPAEKAKRFSDQLKDKKVAETGKPLTEKQKAYRAGYLASRRDSADAYNAKERPETHAANKAERKANYFERKADKLYATGNIAAGAEAHERAISVRKEAADKRRAADQKYKNKFRSKSR